MFQMLSKITGFVGKGIAKVIAIGLLFALMISFMVEFNVMISTLIRFLLSSFSSSSNINLGYVAGVTGLSDFLNLFFASLSTAGGLYLSGMVSIIIFKYSVKTYRIFIGS